MSSSLFREEAIEHQKDKLFGDVFLLQPLSIGIMTGVAVCIGLLILALLIWGSYARKESVRGYLTPDKGIVKIYMPQPGTISKVHITEGQNLNAGDLIFTVQAEKSLQGGKDVDVLLLEELESSIVQKAKQIEGEKSLLSSDKERYQNVVQSLKHEILQIEHGMNIQSERLKLAQSRYDGAKRLKASGNISENDLQKSHEEHMALEQQLQELKSTLASKQNNLMQTETELLQLPIKHEARVSELGNAISDLKQRRAQVQGQRLYEMHSPISGVVTALQAKEGQWFNNLQNAQLLALLPKGSLLKVEIFVPTRAIGFVRMGQTVRVRFDAFPYQRYGIYEGKIESISQNILVPQQDMQVPLELKEPVYRVTVQLQNQAIMAYGKSYPLQAGMSVEADIILEKQTLWRWILDPLYSFKGRFS